jgi:deoxyribonuclease V
LAPLVVGEGDVTDVRYVAAADVAFVDRPERARPEVARAAVVVLSYPSLDVIEERIVEVVTEFPYVPGLLSFREVPVLSKAFEKLEHEPDLLFVDGHGRAHPRRFGIACHLGLSLDVPTIGVGKTRLCGEHSEPAREKGATTMLVHRDEVIGHVLRSRDGVKPLYVSVGHRIGLTEASEWTLRLCQGFRLPEPIRVADRVSKGGSASR